MPSVSLFYALYVCLEHKCNMFFYFSKFYNSMNNYNNFDASKLLKYVINISLNITSANL